MGGGGPGDTHWRSKKGENWGENREKGKEKQPNKTSVVDLKLDESSDKSLHFGEEENNDNLQFSPFSSSVGDYVLVKFQLKE